MGNPDGSPIMKDYQDTLVVFYLLQWRTPYDQGGGLLGFLGRGPPSLPGPPGGGLPGPPGSTNGGLPGPPGPPGGGSLGPSGDSGSQCSSRQSFMWQSGSALDQSIADMNRSIMQLLTAQQAANVQLQL